MDLNAELDNLSLAERSNIVELDRKLHTHWGLGRNFILGWCARDKGVALLIVPHYTVAEYALSNRRNISPETNVPNSHEAANFVMDLLACKRHLSARQMENAGRLLDVEPVYIELRQPLSRSPAETVIVEKLVGPL